METIKTPVLHELVEEFDERNLWLQLWLGGLALCDELDESLASLPASALRAQLPEVTPDLYVWLGLISLRNRIRSIADDAARSAPSRPTGSRSRPRTPQDLLR